MIQSKNNVIQPKKPDLVRPPLVTRGQNATTVSLLYKLMFPLVVLHMLLQKVLQVSMVLQILHQLQVLLIIQVIQVLT